MKNIFLSLSLLFAMTASLFAQAGDEKAVRQALEAFQTAIKNNAPDAAGKLLTEKFWMRPGFSLPKINRVQRLEGIKSGQFKYGSYKDEDVKIHINVQGAYVSIKTNVTFNIDSKEYTVSSVELFFEKVNENWLLAYECFDGLNCYR